MSKQTFAIGRIWSTKFYSPLNVPRHKDVSLYWFDAHLVRWEGEQIEAFFQRRNTEIITEKKYRNPEICKALKNPALLTQAVLQ